MPRGNNQVEFSTIKLFFIFAGYLRTNTMLLHRNSLLAFLIVIVTLSTMQAQDVKESQTYQEQKKVYELGKKYGDVTISRNALYNLMAQDPSDASLLDSLAYMYYEYQQYTSCLLVCLDILKITPDHMAALEMSAVSYENIGLKDKALTAYESIYLRNSSIYTLYRIAVLQYDLDRPGESSTNIKILLEKEETKSAKIAMNTDQGTQQISLEAAVYNLKGLLETSQGQTESAKESYQQAIAIEPSFTLAKTNLEKLN